MRIFVAGGAGAIGRLLVPMAVAASHEVTATTRKADRATWIRSVGADAVVLDAYDAGAVERAIAAAHPEVVIDQLTDLSAGFGPGSLRSNAGLREVTTAILVAAAERAGVRRFVAQSGAWLYAPGPLPHTEDDPLGPQSVGDDDVVLPGILALERAVLTARLDGVVLRYG
jgi:nucleoside-diphosphate-sugar epimerase